MPHPVVPVIGPAFKFIIQKLLIYVLLSGINESLEMSIHTLRFGDCVWSIKKRDKRANCWPVGKDPLKTTVKKGCSVQKLKIEITK